MSVPHDRPRRWIERYPIREIRTNCMSDYNLCDLTYERNESLFVVADKRRTWGIKHIRSKAAIREEELLS